MFSQYFNQAIIAICVNFQQTPALTQYYYSCTQILTAASIQTHVTANVQKASKMVEDKAMEESKYVTNVTGTSIWAVGMFTYTTYVKQTLAVSVPVKPVADNLSLSANIGSQNLSLSWSF